MLESNKYGILAESNETLLIERGYYGSDLLFVLFLTVLDNSRKEL